MATLNQRYRLSDGRILGYDELGVADGRPVFFFHGTPGARPNARLLPEDLLRKFHIRLIAVDRPGVGLSDFQPGRRFSDWPSDVAALADGLGIERFAVLGYSGGGPYAAACARHIPDRLTRAAIVSGAGPFEEPGLSDGIPAENLRFFSMARRHPVFCGLMLRALAVMARRSPDRMLAQVAAALPEQDRAALSSPGVRQVFQQNMLVVVQRGSRGAVWDTALMVGPWDFRLQDIDMPVYLWHGDSDRNVPPAMARFVAGAIPACHAVFYPGEGHLSLIVNRAEEILQTLAE